MYIIPVMAASPQHRMCAHDYRHNVAANDVAYKYTNSEASKAFNDSAATIMQKWARPNWADAKQFLAEVVPPRPALTENHNICIFS